MEKESPKKKYKDMWSPLRIDTVNSEIIKRVSSIIDTIPALPSHVYELFIKLTNYENDFIDIANLISSEPLLASKILNVANSSFYGLTKKLDNLHHAIVLLGFEEVRNIAIHCSLSELFDEDESFNGYTIQYLRKHSHLVSICAESFASQKDLNRSGVLMTLGLVHDIGKFVLWHYARFLSKEDNQSQGYDDLPEKVCILEKEEKIFNLNHAIAGKLLAEKWNLSPRICAIIEFHHYPSFFNIDLLPVEYVLDIAIISIADYIVNNFNKINYYPKPRAEFFEILGLYPDIEKLITPTLQEKFENARFFL